MWSYNYNTSLCHHGIIGMKWGVRRYQNKDGTLTSAGKKKYRANESDSSVTKKVKKDLASLSGSEFRKKYGTSTTTYMKRVDRYGDPYMNAPLAKIGKFLEKEGKITTPKIEKLQKRIDSLRQVRAAYAQKKRDAIQKDIDSFKPFLETGIKDKSGRLMLSPEDIAKSIEGLEKLKNKI